MPHQRKARHGWGPLTTYNPVLHPRCPPAQVGVALRIMYAEQLLPILMKNQEHKVEGIIGHRCVDKALACTKTKLLGAPTFRPLHLPVPTHLFIELLGRCPVSQCRCEYCSLCRA